MTLADAEAVTSRSKSAAGNVTLAGCFDHLQETDARAP